MKRLASSVLLLAVASVGGAPAPFSKAERPDGRTDQARLQGEWEVVCTRHYFREGDVVKLAHEFRFRGQVVMRGDRIRLSEGPPYVIEEVFRLDPAKSPKVFDSTIPVWSEE